MSVKFYVPRHEDRGDYVMCCNCGKVMVVRVGTDDCPACGAFGCLAWADDTGEFREVNVREFKLRLRNADSNSL